MVNIKQVANTAQVSTASVSRYLKDPNRIKNEPRKRIRKAINELNYRPSRIAQSMRNQNPRTIALVFDDISSPSYADTIHGAEQYASEKNYDVVIVNVGSKKKGKVYNNIISRNAYAGAIFFHQIEEEDNKYLKKLKNMGFPFVVTQADMFKNRYLSVSNNNYKAAYDGTEYLIKRGHKKIALIEMTSFLEVVKTRKNGYLDALDNNSLYCDKSFLFKAEMSIDGGIKIGKEIIHRINNFSAIFCLSDYIAIGLLKYLQCSDIKVPEDISLLGFDDIEWTKVTTPTLTTVHQRRKKLGFLSVEKIISCINKDNVSDFSIFLESYIVERESVKSID